MGLFLGIRFIGQILLGNEVPLVALQDHGQLSELAVVVAELNLAPQTLLDRFTNRLLPPLFFGR